MHRDTMSTTSYSHVIVRAAEDCEVQRVPIELPGMHSPTPLDGTGIEKQNILQTTLENGSER